MYQADFICTYKFMDTTEEQDQLYKLQLLQAFGTDEWDDDVIATTLEELYAELNEDIQLQAILLQLSNVGALQMLIENESDSQFVLFKLLFQYEYFDLFHKCVIEFREKKTIGDKTGNALSAIISTQI
jgi:hypothetical protein